MTTLATTVDGLKLPNPFIIASGPPGTNANVIGKAFDEGWGAVVCKTVILDATKINNVQPRYARLRSEREIYGWENIELITDRPFEVWLDEFKKIKDLYPERVLIASVMEEFSRDAWHEIIERSEKAGVDGFELNLSCPHGLPEQKMGSAMGENQELVRQVCGWVNEVTDKPVWAKMTPNVTRIQDPTLAALEAGVTGISAINTIRSIIGVNLNTLRPEPTVAGYSTPGGYSSLAIRPIALRMVAEIGALLKEKFPGCSLSGIGGIETGEHAAEYILLGADTVQICTGVMKHGYKMISRLQEELLTFMEKHHFSTLADFKGISLAYLTTHAELVRRLAAEKSSKKTKENKASLLTKPRVNEDSEWSADDFVNQSDQLTSE